MLQSFLMGLALGSVGGWLAKQWRRRKEGLSQALTSVDDAIETRLGIDIPDPWQQFYDNLVIKTVLAVDKYAADPAFWRQAIRFFEGKPDGGKIVDKFMEVLKDADWAKPIEDQIPENLKPLYNEFKQYFAAKIVTAKIDIIRPETSPGTVKVQPPVFARSPDRVVADVKNAVVVAKIEKRTISAEESNDPKLLFERLARESAERQKNLSAPR